MSLASMSKGKEITYISTLLSIFGAVEAKQMRLLFNHLKDDEYGKIMTKMSREGLIWHGAGGNYVAFNEHAANYVDLDKSVMMCWAFISVKHLVREICSGDGLVFMTFASQKNEYDLIYLGPESRDEIQNNSPRQGDRVHRLFVAADLDDAAGLTFARKNDHILVVSESGEVTNYDIA